MNRVTYDIDKYSTPEDAVEGFNDMIDIARDYWNNGKYVVFDMATHEENVLLMSRYNNEHLIVLDMKRGLIARVRYNQPMPHDFPLVWPRERALLAIELYDALTDTGKFPLHGYGYYNLKEVHASRG